MEIMLRNHPKCKLMIQIYLPFFFFFFTSELMIKSFFSFFPSMSVLMSNKSVASRSSGANGSSSYKLISKMFYGNNGAEYFS